MAALTTNVVPNTGVGLTALFAAAGGGGDTAVTGQGVFLLVKNTDGTSKTVTVVTPQVVDGDLAVADRTFTVAATTGEHCIPLPDLYRDPATGRASITYSAVTGVTVCVVRVP